MSGAVIYRDHFGQREKIRVVIIIDVPAHSRIRHELLLEDRSQQAGSDTHLYIIADGAGSFQHVFEKDEIFFIENSLKIL